MQIIFGDRCSPISASALLVADLTGTDFYNNLKRVVKSAAVPFVLTCAAYFALGPLILASGEAGDMAASLASAFAVGPVVLLPPVIVFALALMRVDILVVIGAGIDSVVRRMSRRLSPYGGYAGDVCVYGDYFLQPDVGHHAGAPAVRRS